MTCAFDKFRPYMVQIPKGKYYGYCTLRNDTPEELKIEARELDKDYFRRTGRHKLIVDVDDVKE
ncbi:MAG: hypothetical protein MSH60_09015 [Ruminococcus sp.]|nr:hypothetical protein [Ruminococcus sp.]